VLGQRTRDRRRESSPASAGEDEVADLDDAAFEVEVMEHAGSDQVTGVSIQRGQRKQPTRLGEPR
jgi:hypothetical protein